MRAGPLSNPRVVTLLNRYFVPAYIANEDYGKEGCASAEEKAERRRLLDAFMKAKLPAGSVQAFIFMDGKPVDSMHVVNAAKVEQLVPLMERTVAALKLRGGPPVVKPAPQAACPRVAADALAVHVTTRYLQRKGNTLVTYRAEAGLGKTDNASWTALPGEDWVVLAREEGQKLVGKNPLQIGAAWKADRAVLTRIFTHFYPPSENNDTAKNRILGLIVWARVISRQDDVVRIRLDGRLQMEHSFHHNQDHKLVDVPVLGYVDYDSRRQRLVSFQLASDGATYGGRPFAAIVQSPP
jgi:hypothetical protein